MRQIFRPIYGSFTTSLTIALAFGLLFLPPSAAVEEQSATSMVESLSDSSDGYAFLQSLIDRVKAINDYWYESTLTTFTQKGKKITESGRFYFKTPRMVRFEALKAGRRSGSVVVCQPDGKIRAKAGGMMGGITLTLSPKSKMLRASNGYNIVESDLSSLLESLRSSVKSGLKCVASKSPCPYPGLARAYILEFIGNGDFVTQRIALDTERKLPTEWAIFDNGKILSLAHITKIAINANIADDLFFIDRQSDEQKALGVGAVDVVDRLEKKLGAMGVLNLDILADVKQASNELKRTSEILRQDKLTEHPSDRPESIAWLTFGRSLLLTRTAKIELIAESLKELWPAIQNFENNHSACIGSTEQWLDSLELIDQSISNLYAMLESDEPDPDAIAREAESIKAQDVTLDGIILQISENLD